MFAVIKTGGKQYTVAADDKIKIEKIAGEVGDIVTLGEVLMLGGDSPLVGLPLVAGASVAGEVIEQGRGDKVIAFKKRRRQNSRRKRGHRQMYTLLRITEILTDGKKPSAKKAEARKPAAKKPVAASADVDASNLSLIAGIGPTLEKKLRAAGVTSWNDIAAWSEADVAKFDTELKLGGRATRDEWVEQAKELLAGKPPRAKVDQAEQASGEDH
jgi:large subunit ribosomal protein L21